MDFFDNVMNKSNAIIKEKLNNPFGSKQSTKDSPNQSQDGGTGQPHQSTGSEQGKTRLSQSESGKTPCLESTARQQHQLNSQASNASNQASINSEDQNNGDQNSQFAAIAADAEAVAQKAAKGAKNIGTFLFSMANKAGQTVTQTAKQVKQAVESTTILTDFTREQQDFIKQHGGSMQPGELPWNDCQDETKAAYIREQILSLSQDKRNFVRSPPNDAEFKFDPQACYPTALSLLREDPNLNNMRYELVPKLVNEDTFWRNYFYRVTMLRRMSEKGERAKHGWSSSRSSSGEGPDEEGADTSTPHGTIDEPAQASEISSPSATTTVKNKQDSFRFEADKETDAIKQSTTSDQQAPQQQYQTEGLGSDESRELFAESDDLKRKLRELNIGSLDDGNDEDNDMWEEELQRDLQEFELVTGGDVSALDEEALQAEIRQLENSCKLKKGPRQG